MHLSARFFGLFLMAGIMVGQDVVGQQILVDRAVRAGELWCFPVATDSTRYRYIPSDARLATDDDGRPHFALVRYSVNSDPDPDSPLSITRADGGAVLTMLVTYSTPEEKIADAQRELRRKLQSADAIVEGPIAFEEGRYTLISSIISPSGGQERVALSTGRAPVLEGNAIALSFQLEPEMASLLLESMQMKTPDVSLVYEMTFAGLADAYDADLVVDWTHVQQSAGLKAGGSIYFIGADVDVMIDKLRQDNAVTLNVRGSNANMEGLVNRVYDRVVKMLFDPVEPARVPEEQKGGIMDALSVLTKPETARAVTGFGFNAAFKFKKITREGTTVLHFNQQETVQRYASIVFNIGDFYKEYGDDPAYFRAVNLYDPTYEQRVVHIGVDGALLPEFDRFVNSVTLTLRKRHQNGVDELRELVLDRARVGEGLGSLQLVYGWNGDDDRNLWLEYDYRTRWSFQGGGAYETDWHTTSTPMIDLFAPYERRSVDLLGDLAGLAADRSVRAVVVKVSYAFFGEDRTESRILYTAGSQESKPIELTQPLGEDTYSVSLLWQLRGGERVTTRFNDDTGLIVVDEIPAP